MFIGAKFISSRFTIYVLSEVAPSAHRRSALQALSEIFRNATRDSAGHQYNKDCRFEQHLVVGKVSAPGEQL